MYLTLWNVIRQRFEPEAGFGNFEIWHRRSAAIGADTNVGEGALTPLFVPPAPGQAGLSGAAHLTNFERTTKPSRLSPQEGR